MERLLPRAIVNWSPNPIPGFSPSAGGLIALADLSTISRRTAIAGGSSWLDALLLAPGLHYQQAADALIDGSPSSYSAVELLPGKTTLYSITNRATIGYLQRIALTGQVVVVNVGPRRQARESPREARRRKRLGLGTQASHEPSTTIGGFSHALYLASPVLTAASLVFMVLLEDWWGVGLLLALMFSRVLNIWVIKQRSKPPPPPAHPAPSEHNDNFLTEYLVEIGDGGTICLRGLGSDLQAITTGSWLSTKTHVQGYLEAAAKLTVYLVAAFSGQLTQLGNIIFMALLLITAGLLGLSNAHDTHLQMHGRVAAICPPSPSANLRPLSGVPTSSSSSSSSSPQVSKQPFGARRHLATERQGRSNDDTAATTGGHNRQWYTRELSTTTNNNNSSNNNSSNNNSSNNNSSNNNSSNNNSSNNNSSNNNNSGSSSGRKNQSNVSNTPQYGGGGRSPSWPASTMTRYSSSSDQHDNPGDLAEKGQVGVSVKNQAGG
ncbi:uncharacterized protein B0I36DRAFT_358970 [Microdochium trichocladiopsis]|uniref:Uncharacterized protein n=1 Tax=Microdochium trichocladiopsis TaxID=1682393 RepID=A0A9P8YFU4_9PEZI|nr:uncharacterized protein B0I36DRAFT_358970 [Microdochium trichocladiopsis]KAH7037245.1 hypothetical protein B0I36DRAFT_358970 [Microdochium trichocladiopsis]